MVVGKFLKNIGRFFITLNRKEQKDIRQSLLLVDGSFILPNNFILILNGVKEKFKNAKIEVLTFEDKKEFLQDNFPDIKIITPDPNIRIKRFRLYIQLLKLLRENFTFIVLTSLDIIPLGVCLFLSDSGIFLHNKWLEWYEVRIKNIVDILSGREGSDKNRRKRNNNILDFLKSFGRNFVILEDLGDKKLKTDILIVDNGYTLVDHVVTAIRCAEETFIHPSITILTFTGRKDTLSNIFPGARIVVAANLMSSSKLAWQMYRLHEYKFGYIVLTSLDILPIIVAFFSASKVLLYNR